MVDTHLLSLEFGAPGSPLDVIGSEEVGAAEASTDSTSGVTGSSSDVAPVRNFSGIMFSVFVRLRICCMEGSCQ